MLPLIVFPWHAVPSQVTRVTMSKAVRSGRPALAVAWTVPYSDVSISQYQVHYRRNGTTSWSATLSISSAATSTFLEMLFAGSDYQIQVRALSPIGNGTWSVMESETTYQSEFFAEAVMLCNYYLLD